MSPVVNPAFLTLLFNWFGLQHHHHLTVSFAATSATILTGINNYVVNLTNEEKGEVEIGSVDPVVAMTS